MTYAALWIHDRAHIAAAGVANAAGWISGFDTGATITALTAFIGLGAYGIKTFGNAMTEVRLNRDKAMAGTIGDQMERLNRNLEDAKDQADAQSKLAQIAQEQADRLQEMYLASQATISKQLATITELSASVGELKDGLNKARVSLHDIVDNSSAYKLHSEQLQAELDEYKNRLGPVIKQVADNRSKLDAVTDFGHKVADAAVDLAHSAEEPPRG
jgi:chromosome segregation ATPase